MPYHARMKWFYAVDGKQAGPVQFSQSPLTQWKESWAVMYRGFIRRSEVSLA
ncbi:MAG TPA: hypothetical protein PKD17_18975 [Cellvibrionaceae bacterium]|nr:hypothetical protein [Cellvibrionaceae bacterium]